MLLLDFQELIGIDPCKLLTHRPHHAREPNPTILLHRVLSVPCSAYVPFNPNCRNRSLYLLSAHLFAFTWLPHQDPKTSFLFLLHSY